MSERKIRKLTEMIDKSKREVKELEERLSLARLKVDRGEITKAEFTRARMDISNQIRGKRTTIARFEKARLNLERADKEKKEEEEEELEKRRELRVERRREREKEKRRRAKGGDDEDEEEKPKKKGFFSFFGR